MVLQLGGGQRVNNSPPSKKSFYEMLHRSPDLDHIEMNTRDTAASGYGPGPDSCEHGNEPSGSIKGGEFLD